MLGKWDLNLLIPCLVMSWQSYLAKESIACLEMRSCCQYKLTALSAGGCGSRSGDPGWCRWSGGSCPAPAQPGSHWRRQTSPGAWRTVNNVSMNGTFLDPDLPDCLVSYELAVREWEGLQTGTVGGQLGYWPIRSWVWLQLTNQRPESCYMVTNQRPECSPGRWSCQWWGHTPPGPSSPACGKIEREPAGHEICLNKTKCFRTNRH